MGTAQLHLVEALLDLATVDMMSFFYNSNPTWEGLQVQVTPLTGE